MGELLKMLLLGRGISVPMPVILIGAIGGMMRAGMVGLFVGPVVLAIFHQLFNAWLRQGGGAGAAAPPVSDKGAR